jgi:hypothetical protein
MVIASTCGAIHILMKDMYRLYCGTNQLSPEGGQSFFYAPNCLGGLPDGCNKKDIDKDEATRGKDCNGYRL